MIARIYMFVHLRVKVSSPINLFLCYMFEYYSHFIFLPFHLWVSHTFNTCGEKNVSRNGPSSPVATQKNGKQSDKPFTEQFEVISQLRSFHPPLKMDCPLPGNILGEK